MSMMESFYLSTSLDASTCVTVASIDVAYGISRWKSSHGFPSLCGFAIIIFLIILVPWVQPFCGSSFMFASLGLSQHVYLSICYVI